MDRWPWWGAGELTEKSCALTSEETAKQVPPPAPTTLRLPEPDSCPLHEDNILLTKKCKWNQQKMRPRVISKVRASFPSPGPGAALARTQTLQAGGAGRRYSPTLLRELLLSESEGMMDKTL